MGAAHCQLFYRKVLTHNLALRWWGFPFGVAWTIMALVRNRTAFAELRRRRRTGGSEMVDRPDGARHRQRDWDGQAWTDEVTCVTVDTPGAD